VIQRAVISAAILVAASAALADEDIASGDAVSGPALVLDLPLACTLGDACWIAQYQDEIGRAHV